jgi:hypothetical protein
MRRLILLTLVLAIEGSLRADNAIPIAARPCGDRILTLFAHPAPLRAGPVELSLMITDQASGRPVLDWKATAVVQPLALTRDAPAWVPPCCQMSANSERSVPFTRNRSANAFLRTAAVVIATPGKWMLHLDLNLPDGETRHEPFEIAVGNPAAPFRRYWPWFAGIPIAIIGYALTQKNP